MKLSAQQQKDIIQNLLERATVAFLNENRTGAAYLVCIAGMWSNCFMLPNVYYSEHKWLVNWFRIGYDAFTQATAASVRIRKAQKDKEEGKKPNLFGLKLW